jgi:hypothetical protein
MKKVLSMLLVLILVVSMVGCGGSAKESEPQQETATPAPNPAILLYEKYSDIISALEEENYDGAVSLIEEMKPIPKVPSIKEVIITTDNFFDYFELNKQIDIDYAVKDSHGNITFTRRIVRYVLKEEYTIAEEKKGDCVVEVGVTYDNIEYLSLIDIDFESFSFTPLEEPHIYQYDYMLKGSSDIHVSYEYLHANGVNIIDNIELVSASGTIYIYE